MIYKCRVYLWINYILLKKSAIQIGKECKVSETTIRNWLKKFEIKIRKKGFIPWNKGLTKETNEMVKQAGEKIGKKLKGMKRSMESREKQGISINGNKHSRWKDNDAGYTSKHDYIRKKILKPESCFLCGQKYDKNGSKNLSLMNLDHKYDRNNLDSWQYAHYSCHKKYDIKNKLERSNKTLDLYIKTS